MLSLINDLLQFLFRYWSLTFLLALGSKRTRPTCASPLVPWRRRRQNGTKLERRTHNKQTKTKSTNKQKFADCSPPVHTHSTEHLDLHWNWTQVFVLGLAFAY